MAGQKALFLDRDGIINIDHGYVGAYENFDYVDGIFDLIRSFVDAGYLPVIVTNQSGIARGYFTEAAFHTLMQRVQQDFTAAGLPTIPVYYCPHLQDASVAQYRQRCSCRKPEPGMLVKAQADLGLDLNRSVLVGDSWRDIEAGFSASLCHNFYVSSKPMPDDAPKDKVSHLDQLTHVIPRSRVLGLLEINHEQ